MLLVILFAFAFVWIFLDAVAAVDPAQAIAVGIAGVVAPLLAQLLKRLTGMSGQIALFVTLAVSAVVTIVAMYMAGEIHGVGDVIKQIGTVFTIATVIYKLFMAPSGSTT